MLCDNFVGVSPTQIGATIGVACSLCFTLGAVVGRFLKPRSAVVLVFPPRDADARLRALITRHARSRIEPCADVLAPVVAETQKQDDR